LGQINDGMIHFKPTKTSKSSALEAHIPVSSEIQEVLDRAKSRYAKQRAQDRLTSLFVIHTLDGSRYTKDGLRSNWDRACARAGVPTPHFATCARRH
jgi:hypothetical protein